MTIHEVVMISALHAGRTHKEWAVKGTKHKSPANRD